MPRRPPRKPDPALDLAQHLLPLAALSPGANPAALFPDAAPVELEVGSGKGLFLATAAASRPDRNFLGIELAAGYARVCAGRLAAARAGNARIIHGDATVLVRDLLPAACLAAVHVYFPDPWWKARHRKRRVLTEPFLRACGTALAVGGRMIIWTDVEEYFLVALEAAAITGLFGPPLPEAEAVALHDLDYRTHFERRTRLAGLPVHRAVLLRGPAAAG